jgi:hypothetical protein
MNVKKGIPVTKASVTEEKRTLGQGVLSLVRKIYFRQQEQSAWEPRSQTRDMERSEQ